MFKKVIQLSLLVAVLGVCGAKADKDCLIKCHKGYKEELRTQCATQMAQEIGNISPEKNPSSKESAVSLANMLSKCMQTALDNFNTCKAKCN